MNITSSLTCVGKTFELRSSLIKTGVRSVPSQVTLSVQRWASGPVLSHLFSPALESLHEAPLKELTFKSDFLLKMASNRMVTEVLAYFSLPGLITTKILAWLPYCLEILVKSHNFMIFVYNFHKTASQFLKVHLNGLRLSS